MNRRRTRAWVMAGLMWLAAAQSLRADVLVSAASSLTEVLTEVARRFETTTGERVLLNFGASNTLARQIAAGARVDVFVSADEAQMDRAGADILSGSRSDLLSNQLALAVSVGVKGVAGPRDLLVPTVRRIAIGDPAAVPAGVYARQYLQKLGLWIVLQPKLVPTGSVRLALAAVESGAADVAMVYATDIASARGTVAAFVVPVADGPRISYPAAITKRAPNPSGARRFLAYLHGPDAARVFVAAGFGTIAQGTRGGS